MVLQEYWDLAESRIPIKLVLEGMRVVCYLRVIINYSGGFGKVEMLVFDFTVRQKYFATILCI